MDILNTKTYFYHLPQELIAQHPLEERDKSKLLVYNKDKNEIEHKIFKDIINYFNEGDVLVVNNTKVIPARLFGIKTETNAKIEVLLLKRKNLLEWEVLIKPVKRVKIGTEIVFNKNLKCNVMQIKEFGLCEVKFTCNGIFEDVLNEVGTLPLPHYIKQNCEDFSRYNTIYSEIDGSSAAPTAGLHFTNEIIQKLKEKGVIITHVLLHIGLGTFKPVTEDNILNHKMHTEYFEISNDSANIINNAKTKGKKVIAVGTTTVRTLESAYLQNGQIKACSGETNIFIYPEFNFNVINGMLTNFHLPESTLIMLVSAFLGVNETMQMYKLAVNEKYRFFSFGDCCLLI